MCIKMTIEVTPEQAAKIAELLCENVSTEQAVTSSAAFPAMPAPVSAPVLTASVSPLPVMPVAAPVHADCPASISAPVQTAPPTAVKQYTQDELSLASRPIVEAGRQQELLDLLHSFTFVDPSGVTRNVQSIRDLPVELYPAFANGIRQLGGRI